MAAETSGQLYESKVIAQLFGVSVRRIQQLAREQDVLHLAGCHPLALEPGQLNKYDLIPTIQAYIKYLSDKAYGREAKLSETELREKKLQAEIALKESQTELHQLRTAIANGKYISIEEAQADYTKFFAVLKRFCSGLPSRVVGMIGSRISPVESRELEKDLNKEINDILRTFVLAATVKDGDGG